MAIPSATGVEITRARTDEYSVPQMSGRAPNSAATGSQISVCQNCQPNFSIDSDDCRPSSYAIAPTIAISSSANVPVPMRKISSSGRAETRLRVDRCDPYCVLIVASDFNSRSTTAFGSGA